MRFADLFRVKPIDGLLSDADLPGRRLKRTLGPWQLISLGVGATIGAGIFSTVGTAAAGGAAHAGAGPALVLSFLLVSVACGFAALCYAEFAAMVPMSGSAYTYAFSTMGELAAWIIGWDLIIEYAIGNVAVAISWSGYFQELLRGFGLDWPNWLGVDYRTALQAAGEVAAAKASGGDLAALGASVLRDAQAWSSAPRLLGLPLIFNLPASLAVLGLTWVLVVGIRESARFNTAMVLLKLAVIAFFVVVGVFYVKPANWAPFAPNGFTGIAGAAAIIFFAYIGFDAVSTAAEETREPQRNMPIGMIGSLGVCTLVYVVVALVLTGMVKWNRLGTAEPLATAFSELGMNWTAGIISFGALFATTSVLLVFQLGQPRIFFSMARDGLLPGWAARVHPRYHTPYITTIVTGLIVAACAGLANINEVVELCNIGTLFAFVVVAGGILILRRAQPARARPFRVPLFPWVPLAAIGTCGYLMLQLPWVTWRRFLLWLAIGLVIYFTYGRRHSRVGGAKESGAGSSAIPGD
jgi:APA family basic amino acid/polyamine antiporter